MAIESESKFVWKFIWKIILTPITFFQVIFGKKHFKDLFEPFKLLWEFIFEAKFTIGIIILTCITTIYFWYAGDSVVNQFIQYPSDLLSARIYTLITSGFMHASWSHLLWNMLALFIFGRVVEKKLGAGKTSLVYFGALIISGIFSSLIDIYITNSNIPGLGASGAIMGLVSAAILLDPFYFTYDLLVPLPVMLVGWLTIYGDISGVLNPTEDGIGHFAHIGGFLSIAILFSLLHKKNGRKLKKGF